MAYLEGLDSCYFHLLVNWLGDRKDGLYDMNIGTAPPIVVLPWYACCIRPVPAACCVEIQCLSLFCVCVCRTRFGETEEVLNVLKSVREGARTSPTVTFQDECPAPSPDIRVVTNLISCFLVTSPFFFVFFFNLFPLPSLLFSCTRMSRLRLHTRSSLLV